MVARRDPHRHNRNAVPISQLLGPFLQRKGFARGSEHRAVFAAWELVVPKAVNERTRAVSFRNGTLIVIVESAPLMEELRCFRADEFLSVLNEALERDNEGVVVRKVEFRRR